MTKKSFLTLVSALVLVFMLVGCGNNDSCTIGKSFGTRSLTRKEITQTCIAEIAKADFAVCGWDRNDEAETAKHISYLQTLTITFGKVCKEQDTTVECPDFIPESLKLAKLTGCEVYSIEPDTDCMAPCADLYFSTNDDTFHSVYVGGFGGESITSSDKIKEASFASTLKVGSNDAVFTWSEKSGDEKKVSVEMIVADSSAEEEPVPTEDADIEMNDGDAE